MSTGDDEYIQNMLTTIMLTALEDGIITEEEQAILKQVKMDLLTFQQAIKDAEEDGIVTEEELDQINKLRKELLENAYRTTTQDQLITSDERALISTLIKILVHKKVQFTEGNE